MSPELETYSDAAHEPLSPAGNRLSAEAYVLGKGLSGSMTGFKAAASDALEHPGSAAVRIAETAAFGLAVGYLSRGSGLRALLGRGVSVAAGLSFCADALIPFLKASRQSWNAGSRQELDLAAGELSLATGKFMFDTLLTAPAAFGGAALGAKGFRPAGRPSEAALPQSGTQAGIVAEPGYHFKAFSPRMRYLPHFDYGVEITERRFLNGQPNLDHHGPNYTYKDLSASEQALKLPVDQLPAAGAKIATVRFDSDSALAMAVLANRKSGRPVNADIVDFVGKRDRGLAAERPTDKSIEPSVDALDQIVLNAKKNYVKDLDSHVRRIQSVLDNSMPPEELSSLAGIRQRSMLRGDERFLSEAPVKVVVPEKLLQVSYDSAVGIPKAQHFAPVVVFENTSVGRITVAGKPDSPASRYLDRAFKKLNQLEPGWEGRDNIFGNMTRMSPEQVSTIVAGYVDPPAGKRFAWAVEDSLHAIKMPSWRLPELEWGKLLQPAAVSSLQSMLFDRHLSPALSVAH